LSYEGHKTRKCATLPTDRAPEKGKTCWRPERKKSGVSNKGWGLFGGKRDQSTRGGKLGRGGFSKRKQLSTSWLCAQGKKTTRENKNEKKSATEGMGPNTCEKPRYALDAQKNQSVTVTDEGEGRI